MCQIALQNAAPQTALGRYTPQWSLWGPCAVARPAHSWRNVCVCVCLRRCCFCLPSLSTRLHDISRRFWIRRQGIDPHASPLSCCQPLCAGWRSETPSVGCRGYYTHSEESIPLELIFNASGWADTVVLTLIIKASGWDDTVALNKWATTIGE